MKLFILLFGTLSFAAIRPHTIPRAPTLHFQTDGVFGGGNNVRANIESLRVTPSSDGGFERWVLLFSDEKGRVGINAPRFQLRYEPEESFLTAEGMDAKARPARFVLLLQSIRNNRITRTAIGNLIEQSQFVTDILFYPQIEDGDMAIEFTLKDNVSFEPHQPVQKEGRLILDIRTVTREANPMLLSQSVAVSPKKTLAVAQKPHQKSHQEYKKGRHIPK